MMILTLTLLRLLIYLTVVLRERNKRRQLIYINNSNSTIMLIRQCRRQHARARINKSRLQLINTARISLQASIERIGARTRLALTLSSIGVILVMNDRICDRHQA